MATESLNIADFGGIVSGKRFVGRENEIRQIRNRVLGEQYGNIAIMGLPRIGKSSLVWQSIMTQRDLLQKENTVPVYYSIGSCVSSMDFFSHLVLLCNDELDPWCDDEKYKNVAKKIIPTIQSEENIIEIKSLCQKYFKYIKKIGFKVIFILDEFDSAQNIFDVSDFQLLRELSYNPDTKICLVTCSRKTIQDIEAQNGALSNFYGIFSEIRLGMYSDNDLLDYWNRIEKFLTISDEYKKEAVFYVGKHPFLLDFYNYYDSQNEDIKLGLTHLFETIIDTLKHENLLDAAIQIVLGPMYNVKPIQIEKLLKYQFLKSVYKEEKINIIGRYIGLGYDDGKTYMCFSDFFTKYFEQEYILSVDYWPLWGETEKLIRDLIKEYVKETYGDDWESEIVAKRGSSKNWNDQFQKIVSVRKINLSTYPNASENLIDYTFPRDMYNVFMSPDWSWFGEIFSGNKKDWAAKFNFLAEIRNPIAHNNTEFLSQEDINKAKEYCELMQRTIKNWHEK